MKKRYYSGYTNQRFNFTFFKAYLGSAFSVMTSPKMRFILNQPSTIALPLNILDSTYRFLQKPSVAAPVKENPSLTQ